MSEFPKDVEKRHYQRIQDELPVQIRVDGRDIQTTTENISCGGMFLPQTQPKLDVDKELVAEIVLPDSQKKVKLAGKVKRVLDRAGTKDGGVAIQFDGLYDDNHLEIDRYVKWKLLN